MRHQKRGRKLGRSASHRKAMLSNMATSVFLHKQIKTTEAKAKEVRRLVERLITYGKKGTTHARRLAFAILRDKKVIGILFDEIAPTYVNRQGGYTRIIKLGYRPNDTAKVVLLQLVDFFGDESKKEKKKSTAKKTASKSAAKKATETDIPAETPTEKATKDDVKEVVEEVETKEETKTEKANAKPEEENKADEKPAKGKK